MTFREIMKYIVDIGPKILTGLVLLVYTYSSIFMPDIIFAKSTFSKMITLTLMCCILTFVLYSKKELSSKKMRNRFIIHCILLATTAPGLILYWNWLPRTFFCYVIGVLVALAIYALVMLHMYIKYKNVTDQLNAIIQRSKE